MSLSLLSPPAAEAVSLAELKEHLRVTASDEDAHINGALVAAARAIEARAGLALMTQQWRLALDAVPEETVIVPIAPATNIDAVTVTDGAGAPQAVDAAAYEFAPGFPGRLRVAAPWPQPGPKLDGVQIDFTAGYADAPSVPEPLKLAIKALAAHFFETREAAGEARIHSVPRSVDMALAPYRAMRL